MEKKKIDKHTYIVSWSEEAQEYLGTCPDFPSLSWFSPIPERALSGIMAVVNWAERDIKKGNL